MLLGDIFSPVLILFQFKNIQEQISPSRLSREKFDFILFFKLQEYGVTPSERREKTLNSAGTCTHTRTVYVRSRHRSHHRHHHHYGHHRDGGVVITTCDDAANYYFFFFPIHFFNCTDNATMHLDLIICMGYLIR